ncbi:MAG TPA: metallophosphoesterase family protein [Ktedonobacteraceae bacterium]
MRLAVISDIHGNCFALDSVLRDIREQGIEQIVCLGDAIQGGAQPAETVQRLRESNCSVVMGNADAFVLYGDLEEPASERQLTVRDWTLAQLSNEDKTFMAQFQPTIEIALEGGKSLLCFHGSPRSFNEIILPQTTDEIVHEYLGGFSANFLTGGHTHTQQLRRLGAGDSWYFNPGSISLAYNWALMQGDEPKVDPWSDYAILTSKGTTTSVTFRHVPFDVDELARVICASGLPDAEKSIRMYLT